MSQDACYRINSQKVAYEIIDDEVIAIHLETGNYYSMEGVSSQVWEWIVGGASLRQVREAFQDLQADQVQVLDGFIESLVQEELIVGNNGEGGESPAVSLPKGEFVFEPTKFAKYDEMQHLIVADPIHDVDERGWPHLEEDNV